MVKKHGRCRRPLPFPEQRQLTSPRNLFVSKNNYVTAINTHQRDTKSYQIATKCYQQFISSYQNENESKHATKRDRSEEHTSELQSRP